MKILNHIIRFFVGGLFIFSGLIKLNDPVGTEIKLEEYFEVFASDTSLGLSALSGLWEFLIPYSLSLAIFLSVLEVVLGANLLIMHRVKFTIWSLFLTIVFFTFLTFYSAYFDKVTDCGCFGDAIKLTPWQSFTKDIVLFILIFVLLVQRTPLGAHRSSWAKFGLSLVATIASFGLAVYAVNYLPPLDFRAYHIGAKIPDNMKNSAELKYGKDTYIYTDLKTGEDVSFETWDNKYGDTTRYKYKDFQRPLLNPEALAKITDFSVSDTQGADMTEATFEGEKLLVIIPDIQRSSVKFLKEINELGRSLEKTKIKTWVFTASDYQSYEAFRTEYQFSLPYYFVDKTVLKTMIRANPGLMYLKEGVVINKWHYNDLPDVSDFK